MGANVPELDDLRADANNISEIAAQNSAALLCAAVYGFAQTAKKLVKVIPSSNIGDMWCSSLCIADIARRKLLKSNIIKNSAGYRLDKDIKSFTDVVQKFVKAIEEFRDIIDICIQAEIDQIIVDRQTVVDVDRQAVVDAAQQIVDNALQFVIALSNASLDVQIAEQDAIPVADRQPDLYVNSASYRKDKMFTDHLAAQLALRNDIEQQCK